MRSRLSFLLVSVVTATILGVTCGGQGLAQTAQGQNPQPQNGAQGQTGAATTPPNPYTANPNQAPAPYTTGPYTGNKAGFYESGGASAAANANANAHRWTPQPPHFKSLYPKADPDNPGAADNPDADQDNGVDMQQQGLGGLGGDTKDTAADTSHPLNYFEPKAYYWCRGKDPNSSNMYYSDPIQTEIAEYHDDFAKKFLDFVRTKYGFYLQDSECFPADDFYSARRDSDHSRSSDQFTNKTIVNTKWVGDAISN